MAMDLSRAEGASYDVTGTQTTVGDSENTFTYKLNENTNADNYTIETKNGSLLVTPVTDQGCGNTERKQWYRSL